jgi:hypothetical protein
MISTNALVKNISHILYPWNVLLIGIAVMRMPVSNGNLG